jgi:RimJ/RimL family protein N-acetyltransferase
VTDTVIRIPEVQTMRLVLRAFRASDLDAYAAMEADPEVRRYRGGNLRSTEESWGVMASGLGQWALRGYGLFALEDKGSGRFAGFAGIFHPFDWPEPEIGYSLARPFWGQGLAREAVTAARDWAFTALRFPVFPSFIMPDNARSIRVAKALGAVREGSVTLRGFVSERWVHRRPSDQPG